MLNQTQDLDEPIWEVKNIAKEIRRTERQTFRLLETGQLPGRKIGGRWVSTRRQLRAAIVGDAA
jgi:hypothetical protein